jgi:hypothetical protein
VPGMWFFKSGAKAGRFLEIEKLVVKNLEFKKTFFTFVTYPFKVLEIKNYEKHVGGFPFFN